MDRRAPNTWIVAVLGIAIGFVAALLMTKGGGDDKTSATVASPTTTTTTQPATTTTATTTATKTAQSGTPQTPAATSDSCISLWNQQNNRTDQTFLANIVAQQAIRVHVGATDAVPPKCLITVVGNDGRAYVFAEAAGSSFPYAPAPGTTDGSSLPAAQKISNALEQSDGTLKAR